MTPSLTTNPLAALTGSPADLTIRPAAMPETSAGAPRTGRDPELKEPEFSDILQVLNISTPGDEATFATVGQGAGFPPVISASAALPGPEASAWLPAAAGTADALPGPVPPPAGKLLPPVLAHLPAANPGAMATGASLGETAPVAATAATALFTGAPTALAPPPNSAVVHTTPAGPAVMPPAAMPPTDAEPALRVPPASSHNATGQGPAADSMLSPAGAQTPAALAPGELAKLQKLKTYLQTGGEPLRLAQTGSGPLTPVAATAPHTIDPALPLNAAALHSAAQVKGAATVPASPVPALAGGIAPTTARPATAAQPGADALAPLLPSQTAATTPTNMAAPAVAAAYHDLATALPPGAASFVPASVAAGELSRLQGNALPKPDFPESIGLTAAFADTATVVTGSDESRAAFGLNATAAADRSGPLQAATVALPLGRPAGAPGWDQALGHRVMWMVENGLNQAELRLDPPHLGSISVRISMHDDQAQVMFQTANPAARDTLEAALPRLREMLAEQGLQLGNTDSGDRSGQSSTDSGRDRADDGTTAHRTADPTAPSALAHAADNVPASPRIGAAGHVVIDEFV